MKQFKFVKYIQLSCSILFDFAFFCILFFLPTLRYTVFRDKNLTILCVTMWILCIGTLGFLIYDIQKILELEVTHHELNKEAYLDNLTGIPNRKSLDHLFGSSVDEEKLCHMGCGVIQLSNLAQINEQYGHERGDDAIQDFCNIFEAIGDRFGFVVRNGGNEYVALFQNCTDATMQAFFGEMKNALKEYNQSNLHIPLSIEYAYILNQEAKASILTDLIGLAYRKLEETPLS